MPTDESGVFDPKPILIGSFKPEQIIQALDDDERAFLDELLKDYRSLVRVRDNGDAKRQNYAKTQIGGIRKHVDDLYSAVAKRLRQSAPPAP